MTQVGGPAAINGFLYQIVHHLEWLASVRLTGELDGEDIRDALLVLEPRSGGDARAEARDFYVVEQYKTREDGTWSLRDMVSVLCDLRKAVSPSLPARARYRFVTNGRAGKLDAFDAFVADVKIADNANGLDNIRERTFTNSCVCTNRDFFDSVNTETQRSKPQSTVDEEAITFHLLSRFEMDFDVSGSTLTAKLERLLRPYAYDLGSESNIRQHLTGVLLEMLSNGEVHLDAAGIDTIFRSVGLNPERIQRLDKLPDTMIAVTRRRLGLLKYQPDRDVREVPKWPERKPVLLISGQSGVGKTWQLGRLLGACGKQGDIVTLVQAAQTHEDLLIQASRDVWQLGLGETSERSLIAVSNFLRELDADLLTLGPIIALDDVQDVDLARNLVRQDWSVWGMRLVLTVPDRVARALSVTDSDACHVHAVGNFSVEELDSLLRRNDQKWADLPPDLKILLRRPILAGLFLDLGYSSAQQSPKSEYEIMERFWKRIAATSQLGAEGIILALAAHMYEGHRYPLLRSMWHKIGLYDVDTLAPIEATGWLTCTDDGDIAFAHERFLNWALSMYLVQQFKRGQLSVAELGVFVTRNVNRRLLIRLGYVPMDVLWLLAENGQDASTLEELVRYWEDSGEFGNFGDTLYTALLPTLGQHAVPILLERLNQVVTASKADYRIRVIGKAFNALAQQEHVVLDDALMSLLGAESQELQNVALAAMTTAPRAGHLDRLWELHTQRCDALAENATALRHTNYEKSFGALVSGISLDTEWLRDRILTADTKKGRFSELGYLLHALEHPDASDIWKDTGDTLMTSISLDEPRSVLHCIARFADRDKLGFVIRHLSTATDFASGAALLSLSVIEPPAAIDRLAEVKESQLYLTRNQWLPFLLRAQPERTRQRILELATTEPEDRRLRFIVDLLWERPDEIDEQILLFLFSALKRDLRKHLGGTFGDNQLWLYHPLDFLSRVTRPDLLAIYEAESGGELESMIAAAACRRLGTNRSVRDHILEHARRVLILMAGKGITTLLTQELESEHFWVRHSGLNWAAVREDDEILERLVTIASRPVPRDAGDDIKRRYLQEWCQSTVALAALGADPALVRVLETTGVVDVPTDLAWLRAHRGPMAKALTAHASRDLKRESTPEDLLVTALVIACISGDTDLIPLVRVALERADKEGRIAAHACIALQALGDSSNHFARLAYDLLGTNANSEWGFQALVSMGNRGRNLLARWLNAQSKPNGNDLDCSVIRALYDNPSTRQLGVNAAIDRCRSTPVLSGSLYDIAAESNDIELREQILDNAFEDHSVVANQPLVAIRSLVKFDVRRAIEAIELGFQNHPGIERQLCHLLVNVAPDIAATRLIESALTIQRESFRNAVGRALRKLDWKCVSWFVIERMRGTVPERKVAVALAGWLPTTAISNELGNVADHDPNYEVRLAALSALDRHRREARIRALLEAFPTGTPDRQWSWIVAVVRAGDPYLLADSDDRLWLGHILSDDIPAAFVYHANWVLRQRRQKEM